MLTVRSLQSCWHVTQRAVTIPVGALPELSPVTEHWPDLFHGALRIAAAHLTRQVTCGGPQSHRWYSQAAAIPEQQSADIHLTEAAVEVRLVTISVSLVSLW